MEESVWWAKSPVLKDYHDHEWGVPKHDDRQLFELLSLEGLQIGLNWALVLNKRAAFNEVFHHFDLKAVAQMTEQDIPPLMADSRLIRNHRKLAAIPHNARAILKLQQDYGSFSAYVWHFTDGQQLVNKPHCWADVPAYTPLSTAVAKDMKQHGITMIGPTSAYSFLQGAGVIDDHLA